MSQGKGKKLIVYGKLSESEVINEGAIKSKVNKQEL